MYYYRGYLKCIKRNKSKGREGWCRDKHTVIILCHRKCQPRNWVLSKARRKTMTSCVSWGKTFPPLEKTAVALLYRKHRNLAVLTHFILLNPSTGNISFLRKKNWDLGRLRSFFFSRPLWMQSSNPGGNCKVCPGTEEEEETGLC